MTDADTDTGNVDKASNVSPIHKQFSSSKIPDELPMKRAILDAFKGGVIHATPAPLVSKSEHEQVSHLKDLKQEIGQYLESATVTDSSLLLQVENTVATASAFADYVIGRCIVHGQKRQYGVAVIGVVLLELKYPTYVVQQILKSTGRTVVRCINEYGWLEPDTALIDEIHQFFVSKNSRERINPPLTDLRPESRRLERTNIEFASIAPLPPANIAAIMRALRAGMDITYEGTPEHDHMSAALFALVGLAVRRGAPMLTLGWAVNVHHNTIRKYAQRSPVAVFSLGVKGSVEQKTFEKKQKAILSNKAPGEHPSEDEEFISVTVHDTKTPVIVLESLAPVPQEFGMTSRPKLRILKKKAEDEKKIATAVLGGFAQYSDKGRHIWQHETSDAMSVRTLYPQDDAELKNDIATDLLVPQRKNTAEDMYSVCDLEVALITIAGVHVREYELILGDGDCRRMLLPLNALMNLAHLIPNNSLEDANKYCRTVEEYLAENNISDQDSDGEDEEMRQILVDNRATELKRYVPSKYHHLVDPNMFDENSMIWTALCNPGHLVRLTDTSPDESVEFDKTVPSLGVVEEGGRIRPPKKRKGGPYARV